MWFDSHCHLHIVEERTPVGAVVDRAQAAGVEGMLVVGINVPSSRRALAIAREHGLWSSAGVHPNSADEWNEEAHGVVESLLSEDEVVAVGETGLDFYRDHTSPEVQAAAFRDHIALAKRHDAALVIHTRASNTAALDMLAADGAPERFVFHCWSGSEAELERAAAMGAFVSFAGNVSFEGADGIRAAARLVTDDRLLVETDSPYLAPVPHRGKPNEPAFVADVGAAVAAARGRSVAEVAAATTAGARVLLGL